MFLFTGRYEYTVRASSPRGRWGKNGKVKDMQGENPGRLWNENNTGRGEKYMKDGQEERAGRAGLGVWSVK